MALSQADVDEFVAAGKVIAPDASWRWIVRNRHNRRCHLALDAGGTRVGEVILVVNLAVARSWTFKLMRRRAEVLRWDFTNPPYRHRNPAACGPGFAGRVTDLEHEHVWTPTADMNCVRGLPGLSGLDHRQALEAFADRANITLQAPYRPPPAEGEQLTL